jgi:Na+-transporting methylmalonyl-CoA/oxaloacetate decarboxylase gamma subunit
MTENLAWGLQMTVVGMGLVFSLLALLWGLLVVVLKFDREPAQEVEPQAAIAAAERLAAAADDKVGAQVPLVPTVQGMDADLVAAIVAAVLAHQRALRREAAPAMRAFWPGSMLHASRWVASGRVRQNQSWRRGGR